MTTHTPGKWNWHTSNSWRRLYSDQGHGKQAPVPVPTINHRDGQPELDVSQADMDLIEAAPRLLATLKKVAAYHADNGEHGDIAELVVEAIAKAEGR